MLSNVHRSGWYSGRFDAVFGTLKGNGSADAVATIADCLKNGYFELEGMEADHIKPWHLGGKTEAANCQMLCKDDNRKKSGI
jgi:5-methylcytosine-specific restriction endonuclease McrA